MHFELVLRLSGKGYPLSVKGKRTIRSAVGAIIDYPGTGLKGQGGRCLATEYLIRFLVGDS